MISLFELDSMQGTKEAMDEARRLAKQLELRDSITLVFGEKAVFDQMVPANASEAMLHFDTNSGEVVCEYSKSREPPLARISLALLGSIGLLVAANLLNIYYVESIGGKIKHAEKHQAKSNQLYD